MRVLPWVISVLTILLVFIWPIPHTITLRDVLILLSGGVLGYLVATGRVVAQLPRGLRIPLYLCLALILWMVIVAVFLSSETAWSLGELAGQWGMGLLTLALGAVTGMWLQESKRRQATLLTMIFAALIAHVIYLDLYGLWAFVNTGEMPRRIGGLEDSLDKASLGAWLAGSFLMAEIVARLTTQHRVLRVHNIVLAALVIAVLFGSYLAASRNGMIVLLLLMILSGAMYVMAVHPVSRNRILILLAGTVIVAPLLVTVLVRVDDRWQTFMQTMPIALDTKHNRNWLELDKPLPTLPDGRPVEDSNYKRIAWLKEGIILVMERPLGRGFGRQIFGHALKEKYAVVKPETHPHNGLLGLAIGAGIPGVVLWIAFCIFLIRLGYQGFGQTRSYAPLALLLLTTGFAVATVLDSMMQDHMLQEFMFLAGLLAVLSATETMETRSARAARHR
ncbi:MAG: O-antigen ligase family protein [Bacteroidota bacterium]